MLAGVPGFWHQMEPMLAQIERRAFEQNPIYLRTRLVARFGSRLVFAFLFLFLVVRRVTFLDPFLHFAYKWENGKGFVFLDVTEGYPLDQIYFLSTNGFEWKIFGNTAANVCIK